jgi:aminoglycoside phosphotransferase family enzyme
MAKKEKHGLFYKLAGISTIKMSFEHTRDMLKSATAKNPNDRINETFDEALERHGIPVNEREGHIIKIYKNMKLSFLIMFAAIILFICLGVVNNIINGNIIPAFLYASLTFAFITVAANNSFRCYQMRKKELGGLSNWLRSPKEWFPVSLKKAWNK